MDEFAVERLSRALARNGTRRWLLTVLGAVPLVGALAGLGEEAMAAGDRHRRTRRHANHPKQVHDAKKKKKKKKRPSPPPATPPAVPPASPPPCVPNACPANACGGAPDGC